MGRAGIEPAPCWLKASCAAFTLPTHSGFPAALSFSLLHLALLLVRRVGVEPTQPNGGGFTVRWAHQCPADAGRPAGTRTQVLGFGDRDARRYTTDLFWWAMEDLNSHFEVRSLASCPLDESPTPWVRRSGGPTGNRTPNSCLQGRCDPNFTISPLKPPEGIEPSSPAYHAGGLPLDDGGWSR